MSESLATSSSAGAAGKNSFEAEEEDLFDEEEGAEASSAEEEALETPGFKAPEGFERISEDVQAYWDPEDSGPMEFIPRSVRLMDNNQDKAKSSALIIGELKKPCNLLESVRGQNAEDGTKQKAKMKAFEPGTSVGVWAKAGMRDLRRMGGALVWIAPAGKRKLPGREKPMALFDIRRAKGSNPPAPLELLEDARKESVPELAMAKSPPWWLDVLPPGSMEESIAAMEAQLATQKQSALNRSKGSKRGTA